MPEEIERFQKEASERNKAIALKLDATAARLAAYTTAAELLWNAVANAGGGDWSKETEEWQKAACLARDAYHSALNTAL